LSQAFKIICSGLDLIGRLYRAGYWKKDFPYDSDEYREWTESGCVGIGKRTMRIACGSISVAPRCTSCLPGGSMRTGRRRSHPEGLSVHRPTVTARESFLSY